MAGRLAEDARPMLDAAAFRIAGSVIEPPDAGEGYRGRAHRAGFERHVEIAIDEAFAFQHGAGGANRQHFRVCRRVVKFARTVPRQDQDVARGRHNGRSDGDFAAFGRRPRFIER